jgi:hypothetical protein
MIVADPDSHPPCQYFLSEYLANRDDPTNFSPEEIPSFFDRYEEIFRSALSTLEISRDQLKGKPEFDFAHADQGNFEGANRWQYDRPLEGGGTCAQNAVILESSCRSSIGRRVWQR